MPDQTAADRAAEVLLRAAPILYAPEREAIIAALMADPDLLVDLAIEAGGLEQPRIKYGAAGLFGENVDWFDVNTDGDIYGPGIVPLYRRREADRAE